MATTRTQRAYQSVTEDGHLKIHIYSPRRDDNGKQSVDRTAEYDVTTLPEKIQLICLAKGFGFYCAGRYSTNEELTPQEIQEACDELYEEMSQGKFAPGRGDARPTPFFEALAEHLKLPIHVVMEKVKSDKATFSPGKLAQMAKFPAVAQITARIERERAAEKEKRAKAALRDAPAMDIAALFAEPSADEEEEQDAA